MLKTVSKLVDASQLKTPIALPGTVGIGSSSASSSVLLDLAYSSLTGTVQRGINTAIIANSEATALLNGSRVAMSTSAEAFTLGTAAGFTVAPTTIGAGSSITNIHGLFIADQAGATNTYGISSLVSSGANKWNIYASGTALNYFAGNVGVGTSSPAVKTHVSEASSGATVELLRLANTGAGANTKSRVNFYAAGGNYGSITGGYGASAPEMNFDINTSVGNFVWSNAGTEQLRLKSTGQLRFAPLAADPAGAQSGDVYYNSVTNKLKVYNGTSWVDLH